MYQLHTSPVWLVLRRHATEMEGMTSFLYYNREKTCKFFPLKIITSTYVQFAHRIC
jgi:hypothetical protein